MKGRKKHKAEGGGTGGTDEAEEDLKTKNEARTNAKKIDDEAEEMKKGGRAKKARGGKSVGVISGPEPPAHAGRKPRKSGGAACERAPFTTANKGKEPKGHKTGGGSSNPLEGENEAA
jgi:hypothetical protein